MDLGLHSQTLWRYRRIVVVGVVLAVVLAVLSAARPTLDEGIPRLVYRTSEVWQSQAKLLVTRPGFREGRVAPPGEFLRFSELADLYAALATSDRVMDILTRQSGMNGRGRVTATALRSSTQGPSPIVAIFGKAESAKRAKALTQNATRAFVIYLGQRQSAAGIPQDQRAKVSVLQQEDIPTLLEPRKKTLPIVILLAVLSATMGLVYVLERVRQRELALPRVAAAPDQPAAMERSAVEPVVMEPVVVESAVAEPVVADAATGVRDEEERVVSRRWA